MLPEIAPGLGGSRTRSEPNPQQLARGMVLRPSAVQAIPGGLRGPAGSRREVPCLWL